MGLALDELRGEGSRGAPFTPILHCALGAWWDWGKLWGAAQCPSLCRGHLAGHGPAPRCVRTAALDCLGKAWPSLSPVSASEIGAPRPLPSTGGGAHPCSAWALCCLFQIHLYTRGCHSDHSLGHLSVIETELLRDPETSRQVRAGPRVGGAWWGEPGFELCLSSSPPCRCEDDAGDGHVGASPGLDCPVLWECRLATVCTHGWHGQGLRAPKFQPGWHPAKRCWN